MAEHLKELGFIVAGFVISYIGFGTELLGREHGDVMDAVAAEMRDPASAQFRNIEQGTTTACGEVNGRNAYGGYAGFTEFVYQNGIVKFEPEKPAGFDTDSQVAYYNSVAQFARLKQDCYT